MSRKKADSKQIDLPLPEYQNPWETKGIFSEHYIRTRLQGSKLWPQEEKVKSLWELSSNLWNKLHIALGRGNEELTKREFLEPILNKLGFACLPESGLPSGGTPDYLLFADEATKESVLAEDKATRCSAAISLLEAKKVNHPLDAASKQETPGRFPHRQVRDYLQDAVDDSGKPYFRWAILTNGNLWRLYCRDAHLRSYFEFNLERASLEDFAIFVALFQRSAFIKDSEGRCHLDYLRDEALQHQAKLEDDLRKRIFNILEQLANGFYKRPENNIKKNELNELYENCLIFLYRLLFVLYAEGRYLLPVKPSRTTGASAIYRDRYSLQHLFPQLKNRLKFQYDELTDLYEEILKLFHLINNGNKTFKIPQYNGGLFDPKKYPLLENWRIGERTLANVLRRLISANIPKEVGEQESFDFKETVDYAGLEVRQLGSIYEGLLENHLGLEDEHLVLRGDKAERKATGTYYTPDYIVQYIVENTLGLLCKEIEKSPEVQARKENSFANAVLKLKVLDPAMGSGHFLVRVTEYLADEIVYHPTTALQEKEVRRGLSQEQEEIAYWRRRVVESCIYGVDLNPLAVELAKLSLWLTCIATDQPLSFLDHHLRPGNSLIGAKLKELGGFPKKKETKELYLFAPDLPKAVSGAIKALNEIIEMESKDVSIIKDKETRWQKEVRDRLKPYRDVADLWTSTFFGTKIEETVYQNIAKLMVLNPKPRTKEAIKLKKQKESYRRGVKFNAPTKMFFHWELEFPEVFFNEDGTPKQNPGFDAVIGNPPWGGEMSSIEKQYFKQTYTAATGIINTFALFTEKKIALAYTTKTVGVVLPDIILLKDYPATRKYILERCQILHAVHWGRAFPEADIDACTLILKIQSNVEDTSEINIIRDIIDWDKEIYTETSIPQRVFRENQGFKFNLYLTDVILRIIHKSDRVSFELGTIAHSHEGIHSGNIRNKLFPYKCLNDLCHPLVFGGNELDKYGLFWEGRFVYYDEKIIDQGKGEYANLARKEYFVKPKLLVQRTGDCIIASYDEEQFYASNNFFTSQLRNEYIQYSLKYLLAILNSPLATWYFRAIQPRVGRLYAELKIVHLNQLPIRRIAFVTPKEEREKLVEKLKAKVKTEKLDEVLTMVEECLPRDKKGNLITKKEKSDVVHDLLAYLAEQMIEMNKEKQKLIKEFLTWLEKEITKASIEAFKNKTKIKKFHEHELDTLIEVLKQNHILVEVLDFGDKQYKALEKAFDTTMSQLTPLKKKLKATDELIDQIVYKLYGLAEEEIKIVESH